jgi:ATP-dependent DNA helicase PIF1
VALSRATNMAGLQVLRFDPSKVRAHDKVRAFYGSLSRAEHINEQRKNSTNTIQTQLKMKATDYEQELVEG